MMVGARSKLLKYLRTKAPERYQLVVNKLGLRR
jgi:ribosomal protein S15P/S13E